jgi:hypothetical protein
MNWLAKTIAQIRTAHWLCTLNVKRVGENWEEQVLDKCWWCGQDKMSYSHIFWRCMHNNLGDAQKYILNRSDRDCRKEQLSTSLG